MPFCCSEQTDITIPNSKDFGHQIWEWVMLATMRGSKEMKLNTRGNAHPLLCVMWALGCNPQMFFSSLGRLNILLSMLPLKRILGSQKNFARWWWEMVEGGEPYPVVGDGYPWVFRSQESLCSDGEVTGKNALFLSVLMMLGWRRKGSCWTVQTCEGNEVLPHPSRAFWTLLWDVLSTGKLSGAVKSGRLAKRAPAWMLSFSRGILLHSCRPPPHTLN